MSYKVISTLELSNTDAEDSEFNFQSEKEAKDYYRNAFTTMAETIVDFGGDFVITLVDLEESELVMRHTISTTLNED
jgi:sRNA-binding regulator protein Hfq